MDKKQFIIDQIDELIIAEKSKEDKQTRKSKLQETEKR